MREITIAEFERMTHSYPRMPYSPSLQAEAVRAMEGELMCEITQMIKIKQARKEYACCLCKEAIPKGQQYALGYQSRKVCARCVMERLTNPSGLSPQLQEIDETISQLYIQIAQLREERVAATDSDVIMRLRTNRWTQQRIASYLGLSQPTIARRLKEQGNTISIYNHD